MIRIFALLALCLTACSSAPPTLEPGPPPANLVALVSLRSHRSLASDIDSFGYLQNNQDIRGMSKVGSLFLAELVEVDSVDGYELDAPIYVVVLQDAGKDPVPLLVVKVANRATLAAATKARGLRTHNGWAVIGPRALVDDVAAWALHELPRRETVQTSVHVDLYPAALGNANGPALLAAIAGMGTDAPPDLAAEWQGAARGALRALGQSRLISLDLNILADVTILETTIVPRPETDLARFAARQVPSPLAMFERLPPGVGTLHVGGRLVAGELRPNLVGITWGFWNRLLGGGPAGPQRADLERLLDTGTGEWAATGGGLFGAEATVLYELAEPAVGGAEVAAVAADVRRRGPVRYSIGVFASALTAEPAPVILGGVPFTVTQQRAEESTLFTPAQLAQVDGMIGESVFGTAGNLLVVAFGTGARKYASEVALDAAAPGPTGAMSPAHVAVLDEARRRGESLVAVFGGTTEQMPTAGDLGWMSFGVHDGKLVVRTQLGMGFMHPYIETLSEYARAEAE